MRFTLLAWRIPVDYISENRYGSEFMTKRDSGIHFYENSTFHSPVRLFPNTIPVPRDHSVAIWKLGTVCNKQKMVIFAE